ncbi:MAG: GDP-mannose 4,6-dehydratase, partial [Lachnospiraceae bacterium]|nr:GDP-mannose 4,6-dehydratase [Lachnospiraceae bacterium]
MDLSFYENRKVLITGHTGFKGSWMCKLLMMAGAQVTGYALEAPTAPSLFELCGLKDEMHSVIGDIRDITHLKQVFDETQPEVVIHMAAQPLVRDSYKNPVYTYDVNVMGTVNVLECVRTTPSVKSVINVTTDKVYFNREWEWGYREGEELNGYDPYSNSKSCSELVTSSYKNSFFRDRDVAVTTARAGREIATLHAIKSRQQEITHMLSKFSFIQSRAQPVF